MKLRRRLARMFDLGDNGARIHSMEGLRGLAVILVFFVHYEAIFGRWLAPAGAGHAAGAFLARIGHTGVDLFFVLSGYLIYGAILKHRGGYSAFMRRRLHRIYPTFAVMFCLYLALSVVLPAESKLPPDRGPALLYIAQNALLLPGLFPIQPIMTVAWSLSYEIFFYALIPVMVGALALRRWSSTARVVFFSALALAFVVHCLLGGLHIRMLQFVSGILVYEATKSAAALRLARGRGGQVVALLALAAVLPVSYAIVSAQVSWLPPDSGDRDRILACWLFFAYMPVVLVAFVAEGPLRAMFSVAPLRWLGNMSYSYYLMHALALKALELVVTRVAPGWHPAPSMHWAFIPVAFTATLMASAALFTAVEKRFSLVATAAARPVPFPAMAQSLPAELEPATAAPSGPPAAGAS